MRALLFLTDGFEELEAAAPADILRRGGVETELVSLTGRLEVTGSHGIAVRADKLIADTDCEADMLILPGGPGSAAYISHDGLISAVKAQYARGGYLAAICAAPVTLGKLGLLRDKTATCYPGLEPDLGAAALSQEPVVADGSIITGRGPGAATAFGLKLLEILCSAQAADTVRQAMLLP